MRVLGCRGAHLLPILLLLLLLSLSSRPRPCCFLLCHLLLDGNGSLGERCACALLLLPGGQECGWGGSAETRGKQIYHVNIVVVWGLGSVKGLG